MTLIRVVVRDRERMVEVGAIDFPRLPESEQRISSAEAVFEPARQAGRLASRTEKMSKRDQEPREAIRSLVQRCDV
jgi:hypothetical protein